MPKILVLNGPNLNLLGKREPGVYGSETLDEIEARLQKQAESASIGFEFRQFNAEHALIERIHAAMDDGTDFIIINPAAFTHTSVALRDALLGADIPFIEVHISNVHRREEFRRHSYLTDVAVGMIAGLGSIGYDLALTAAISKI